MELQSSERDLVLSILNQIKNAISNLQEWNQPVNSENEYYNSSEGMQKLAASCMLIEAIGEGFKKIDTLTKQQLLNRKAEIPWNEIIGMRNHIAHGYFDIDAELVLHTIKNDLQPLQEAIDFFIQELK